MSCVISLVQGIEVDVNCVVSLYNSCLGDSNLKVQDDIDYDGLLNIIDKWNELSPKLKLVDQHDTHTLILGFYVFDSEIRKYEPSKTKVDTSKMKTEDDFAAEAYKMGISLLVPSDMNWSTFICYRN